jgi:hypothetical protein
LDATFVQPSQTAMGAVLEFGRMAHPKVFVSYSHADTKQKERLLKHLGALDDAAEFDVWTDAQIRPGEKWEPAIEQALSNASIAILLISADFLVSDFVRHKEIPAILERREKKDLRLYPILAKPCAWQAVPWIKEIQIRPAEAKPVWRSGGRYADDELAKIVLELLAIIELVIQVQKAADDAARQKAEQDKRQKETEIAAIIASSPAVETFYLPHQVEPPGGVETIILDQHALNADELEAQKIYTQIAADSAKQQQTRRKMLQDLQTKIFNVTQDVQVSRLKKADDAFKGWDKYLQEL